jgi:catechol 2,3-dioxygenase-like lactoylglutathione lyase family enzyme
MATPKLYRVILPVTDLEAAAAFYGAVLGAPGERVSGGRHYFDCGGTILACYDPAGDGDAGTLPPLPEHLYFSVDDLAAVRARLQEAGGKLADGDVHGEPAGGIARRPWGETSFYAADPFGNRLCFVEQGTEFLGGRG